MKKLWILLTVIIIGNLLTGCVSRTQTYSSDGFFLDTFVQVTIYEGGSQAVADEAVNICGEYEKIFSRTDEKSELYRLNEDGRGSVASDNMKELVLLIQNGIEYGEITGGAFDITIEPLVKIWDFKLATVPDGADIEEALEKVSYSQITIDDEHINLNGARVDLGAIAKGYIADRIKEYLIEQGVKSAMINLGGNILCVGSKPENKSFSVGIKKPFTESNEVIVGVDIRDKSVVTSGIYERYFEKDGVMYHHVLDPETGRPSDSGLYSVTIISDESYVGDCLSTACLVMGLQDSMELIDSLDGVYAIFIDSEYNIYYSAGAEDFVRS